MYYIEILTTFVCISFSKSDKESIQPIVCFISLKIPYKFVMSSILFVESLQKKHGSKYIIKIFKVVSMCNNFIKRFWGS